MIGRGDRVESRYHQVLDGSKDRSGSVVSAARFSASDIEKSEAGPGNRVDEGVLRRGMPIGQVFTSLACFWNLKVVTVYGVWA